MSLLRTLPDAGGLVLPFQTTYYLNGHSFIEQELKRAQISFRKTDNAFLAVDDVAALQAAADRLSPAIIRGRLDYWTLILGPKFSTKERRQLNLSRFTATRWSRLRQITLSLYAGQRCRPHRARPDCRHRAWNRGAVVAATNTADEFDLMC
jgi:hypothetical protein